jgi:tetratricopeptide (TPR) repeat protein
MSCKTAHQATSAKEGALLMVARTIFLLICSLLCWSQQGTFRSNESLEPLEQALKLADACNWSDAGPYFDEAEKAAISRADQRSALYARIGIVRSTMEQRVLADMADFLGSELRENPLLQADPELRIFTLQVKGDIDFEIDAGLAGQDWEEVLALSQKINDKKWIRRASGELGLVAFLEGDILTARKLVGTALIEATVSGDVGSQVRYLGAIGTALALMKNFEEALERLNQTLAIVAKNPTIGYSFPTQEAKIQALSGLNRMDEAFSLAREVVREAQLRKKHVKEAQAYIAMGKMALKTNDLDNAEEYFRSAARLTERGGFVRLQAGTYNDLANLKRRIGDIDDAERLATQAAELTQSSGDLYLLPDRLLALANVKISRQDYVGAKETLAQAAESVASVRASLIHSMSAIFNENFLLHARHLNDLPGAWEVLEASRARTTRDQLIQGRPRSRAASQQISKIRLELLRAKTTSEFQRIRERLFLAEASQLTAVDHPLVVRTQVASIGELQQQLREDDLLLEYVLAEVASYCSTARLVKLPSTRELDPLLSRYHEALQGKQAAFRSAQQLYGLLLAPVRQELAVKKRILIARHGKLHLVPVESFIAPNGRYVISLSHSRIHPIWHDLCNAPAADRTGAG